MKFDSNVPRKYKRGVVRSLVLRTITCSDWESSKEEIQKITTKLKKNGFAVCVTVRTEQKD